MLANFFGKSKPATTLVMLVLFLTYSTLAYFNGYFIELLTVKSIGGYARYLFLILSIVFFFNFIVVKNNLTFDNSYAFLFFIVFLGLTPYSFLNEKTILINLVILLFLRKVYSLQSSKNTIQKLFDGGFWLGVGFLLEPITVIFALLFYIAVYVHQKITFRSLLIPVLGFIVPLLLRFTYLFWFDKESEFYKLFNWSFSFDLSQYNSTPLLFSIGLILAFVLFSILAKSPKAFSISNTFRKSWSLILLNLVFALGLIFMLNKRGGSEFIYALFPASIIAANGLELIRNNLIKSTVIAFFTLASIIVYFL